MSATEMSMTEIRADCQRQHRERMEADLEGIDRYMDALNRGANPKAYQMFFDRSGLGGELANQVYRLWEKESGKTHAAPFPPSDQGFLVGHILTHEVGIGVWATYQEILRIHNRVTGRSESRIDVQTGFNEWRMVDVPYVLEDDKIEGKVAYRLAERDA